MFFLIALLLVVGWLYFFADRLPEEQIVNVAVFALLAVGAALVVFAGPLGKLSAQNWDPTGGWYPQEAEEEANNFRGLGLLAFIAGGLERVVLVLRSQQRPGRPEPTASRIEQR